MSGNPRRRSLFDENGTQTYREKLQQQLTECLHFLDLDNKSNQGKDEIQAKYQAKVEEIKKGVQEKYVPILPDLEHYVAIATNFLNKHQIVQEQMDQMMKEVEDICNEVFNSI